MHEMGRSGVARRAAVLGSPRRHLSRRSWFRGLFSRRTYADEALDALRFPCLFAWATGAFSDPESPEPSGMPRTFR